MNLVDRYLLRHPQSKFSGNILIPVRFSATYAFLVNMTWLCRKLKLNKTSGAFQKKIDRWILNYINSLMEPLLLKYQEDRDEGIFVPNAPIWILWWTGLDDAPIVVKRCVKSVLANAKGHPVHILTQDNYSNYIDIPEGILDKMNSKKMSMAAFSDYVRVKLLATHGGLWLDATIFCRTQIPDMCFELPLFTCKNTVDDKYISNMQWTGFCLGTWKGNVLCRFMVDAFEVYWDKHDYIIAYFLIDYLIRTAYESIPCVKGLIDKVPHNNLDLYSLWLAMAKAWPSSALDQAMKNDTVFYKLTWKESAPLTTAEGETSIYAQFLEDGFIQ